jgi:hypothetical protein
MSHELRTPLHAILGMTALALEGDLDDERREYIETARESATTLIALMDDVLDISRIEAERIDLSPREIDIGVLAGETLKSLAPRAHERGLELVLREATVLPRRVLGDAVRIRQVLTNLVSNAIKFTDRGEVVVSISHAVSPTGIDLHLEVADTGIGIPPEEQEQIRAVRAVDGSTARRHGGRARADDRQPPRTPDAGPPGSRVGRDRLDLPRLAALGVPVPRAQASARRCRHAGCRWSTITRPRARPSVRTRSCWPRGLRRPPRAQTSGRDVAARRAIVPSTLSSSSTTTSEEDAPALARRWMTTDACAIVPGCS